MLRTPLPCLPVLSIALPGSTRIPMRDGTLALTRPLVLGYFSSALRMWIRVCGPNDRGRCPLKQREPCAHLK